MHALLGYLAHRVFIEIICLLFFFDSRLTVQYVIVDFLKVLQLQRICELTLVNVHTGTQA